MTEPRLRIGVSSCLLGMNVRYDGGHKEEHFVRHVLAQHVDLIPVCPEIEIGLGTPREPIQLEGDPADPRLMTISSRRDLTSAMRSYALRRVEELEAAGLHGYILKSDSPSCGLSGVKVHRIPYPPVRRGRGVFAAALSSRFPSLPVEEAERLRNPAIKENFIERMFAFYRFQTFLKTRPAADDLLTFHNNSKMTLLAHSPAHYERLSLLAASAGEDFPTTLELYRLLYMEALEIKATRRRHASVLRQLARHIARDVDAADRAEITAAIDNYRRGLVSFAVPLTLLRREFELHPIDWIVSQTYLNPYPAELALRG